MDSLHHHSHDCFSEVAPALQGNQALAVSPEDIGDDEYENSWREYIAARGELVRATSHKIMNAVSEHLPDVKWIVFYEDRSHDAPHGHIEGILDEDGHDLVQASGQDWHDLDWTGDIDEWTWDLYHLHAEMFMKIGSRRRFIIVREG